MMGISIQMGQALQFSILEIALMGAVATVAAMLGLTAGMFTLAVLFFAWYGPHGRRHSAFITSDIIHLFRIM